MNTCSSPVTTYSAGIDLHKGPVRLHVIDAAGTIVYQETITEHKRERMRAALGRFGQDVTVGLESTYNWYWLVDLLEAESIPCQLGHARDIHAQRPGKHKSDPKDAAAMSQMIRMQTFPAVYACPAAWRSTRDLLRKRLRLVEERTQHLLHEGCVADQYLLGEAPMAQQGYAATVVADVDKLIDIDCRLEAYLTTLIDELNQWVQGRVAIHDQALYDVLVGTKGIGPVLALTLMYEIVDIARFPRPQQFSSYCRVVNAQCESAGKTRGAGETRRGNPYLCRTLNMVAVQSIIHQPRVREWHRRMVRQKGRRTARRILAHKWALAVYYMWKRREAFDLDKFLGTAYGQRAQPSH